MLAGDGPGCVRAAQPVNVLLLQHVHDSFWRSTCFKATARPAFICWLLLRRCLDRATLVTVKCLAREIQKLQRVQWTLDS
jgi:hypothetical protein